jgi:hypothetical protein
MDEFDINSIFPGDETPKDPIPFDDSENVPADTSEANISHTPLDLGGLETPKTQVRKPLEETDLIELEEPDKIQAPKPVPRPVAEAKSPVSIAPQPPGASQVVSGGRITGMKVFFTKLQAGSMDFMEEQIKNWLAKNPDIVIKCTNVISGPVVGKKTEPNIIITLWY